MEMLLGHALLRLTPLRLTYSYQGTDNSSVLRAAEVFRPAIIRNCPGLILCHNHPSGDPTPSPEDIELVDHLIIGHQRFVSLKEHLRWD